MSDNEYSIKLTGPGLTVEQEISQATALRILNVVMGGTAAAPESWAAPPPPGTSPPAGRPGALSNPASPSQTVATSIGEFIDEVEAKRNPDKIVAMGVYLQRTGGEQFTADQIKPLFQAAGEPTPANFARDWRWAVTAKWIAPSHDDPKTFYVTASGKKAVEARFPAETRKATAQPAKRRTRTKQNGSRD